MVTQSGIEIIEGASTLQLRQRPWWARRGSAAAMASVGAVVAVVNYQSGEWIAAVAAVVLCAGLAAWSVYFGPYFVEADEAGVVLGRKGALHRYPWSAIRAIEVEKGSRQPAWAGEIVIEFVPALALDNGEHVPMNLGKTQQSAELVRGQLYQFRQRLNQPSRGAQPATGIQPNPPE